MSMKRLQRCAQTIALAALAVPAALSAPHAADLVVVEARGIALKPGDMIDDTKPFVLREGQHVTLIAVNGSTVKLDGPYDKTAAAGEEGGDASMSVALNALMTQSAARTEAGVVRAGLTHVALPEPWLMNVSRNGNVCLRQGERPVFWRETLRGKGDLSVIPGDNSWKAQATWPAGEAELVVHGTMPVEGGGTYRVTLDGNEADITVNIIPAELRSDAMRAAWMAHVGCEAQAEALVKAMH